MKRWGTKKIEFDWSLIASRYHISLVLAELVGKRGFHNFYEMDAFLFPKLEDLHDPSGMKDFDKAVSILEQKILEKKKIKVIGDYDVDGVMSSYILWKGLTNLGAQASCRIPHRVKDGYGLREYMVREAYEEGCDTILTCDNGISAYDAVLAGKNLGMTVVITDHHEVPRDGEKEKIPPADAVVDTKQADCQYPFKELCGAGIAYKVMEALYRRLHKKGIQEFLPYAALATVCDVVPLRGENRILVKYGLEAINQTEDVGLSALIAKQELNHAVNVDDLGFRIGPCINAAGRLSDAAKGFSLLCESNPSLADRKAEELLTLNEQRKEMTEQATNQAIRMIEEMGENQQKVFVLLLENCHESVAGIVAGRIREAYYRPTLILTQGEHCLKGSGRSIPEYHMQQEIDRCKSLLIEYGGHAMAAGFSLESTNLNAFRQKLNENCCLSEEELIERIDYDIEVSLSDITVPVVNELTLLEPFGQENTSPVFLCQDVKFSGIRLCGKENQIARIRLKDGVEIFKGVDFRWKEHLYPAVVKRYGEGKWEELLQNDTCSVELDLLFSPAINDWDGSVQFVVVDCR